MNANRKISRMAITIIIISVVLFYSCDKWYGFDFIISNETKDSFDVSFLEMEQGDKHNLTILPNETKSIYHFHIGGKCQATYGNNNCPPEPLDSLNHYLIDLVIKKNGIITKTDFRDINKWEFTAVDGLGTYKVSVTESDF